MSSQAPRADERLPLVSQRREQHQQLGGGELSRLSTSMAIGAVVVEVQTEEELAVQAACGWEIREVIRSAEKKTNRKRGTGQHEWKKRKEERIGQQERKLRT